MEEKKKDKECSKDELGPDPYAAPDGGWGWVVMIASFICNLTLDGICYTFGVFLVPLMKYFEVEEKGPISMIGGILAGTIQLVGPFVALLVNKFGTRIVCIVGTAVAGFGFFVATFAPNIPVMMLFYSLIGGTGLGLMYVPAVVSVGYYFDKKRALATGISVCGSGAGAFVLPPIAALFLQHYDWKVATWFFAGLCLLCSVCGLALKPLPKRPTSEPEVERNCCQSVFASACDTKLLTNIPFLLLCLCNLFSTQGLYIPYVYLVELAMSEGVTASSAAFLISVVGISNTIGRVISGAFTDLPFVSPLMVTTFSLALGAACSTLMTICTPYWSFVVVSAMFGFFLSAWCAVTPPALVEILGVDLLTSAFGTLTFVRGVAALIGPPIAGFIVDATGSREVAFYISTVLLAISAIICFTSWLAKTRMSGSQGGGGGGAEMKTIS